LIIFQLAPPPITEDDARKGILSLIERGLIPPAAQLTLDPSPVKNRMVLLHHPEDRNKPPCTPGNIIILIILIKKSCKIVSMAKS
jgi:hypothetical protein